MNLFNTALLNKLSLSAVCAVLSVTLSGSILAQEGQPDSAATAEAKNPVAVATGSPAEQIASSELPDSPGTAWAQSQDASPQQNGTPQAATPPSPQTGTSQSEATQDQTQKPQRPVGTAAAEAPKVNGVTAAQPAGVAIAPAKQRRVRTIVLKVGAIVGAGVAVGTVIALTAGTPSKPPGAK
jgi:hypothetical protein